MVSLWSDFLSGCVLGLTAGLSPGPLLTLVIAESVASGPAAGLRVAASPLVTDPPIIALCTLVLAQMARSSLVLGCVSLAGGVFVLCMARDAWKARPPSGEAAPASRSLVRGVVTNLLSPHPYLFWITVGSPLLVLGWRQGPGGPAALLAGFYGCLVGSKSAVALAAGRSRSLLSGRGYRLVLRTMAVALAAFGLFFFRDGWLLLTTGNVS